MSTDITTSPSATAQSIAGTRRAVTVACLVGAVASAGFIAGLIVLHDRSLAELARTPVTVAECLVAGLAFIVLAISLSGLAGATELPSWVRSTVAVGCAFVAIQAWASGSVIANVANRVSDAEFDRLGESTFLLQLLTIPMVATCLVGFVALRIVGWRRRLTTSIDALRASSSVAVACRNMCGVTLRSSPARVDNTASHLRTESVVIGCPNGW
jgi:hypothetical protein